MLRRFDDILGDSLRATDGEIGTVKDLYVDDVRWTVRYLVVETGSWLASRKVLIAPRALAPSGAEAGVVPVTISRAQVEGSPEIDTAKPVSRQHEIDYLAYYGYPNYWDSVGLWGAGAMPGFVMPDPGLPLVGAGPAEAAEPALRPKEPVGDPHLRSLDELVGYDIKASDGEIGHVKGFLIDDRDWALRYLVVDTSRWLVGHLMLISPAWIERVSWSERHVAVPTTVDAIRAAPAWDGQTLPDRAYETVLHEHHGRKGYWAA